MSENVSNAGMRASTRESPSAAVLISLLFFGAGFIAFAGAIGALIAWPDLLLGDPYRNRVLALAHLVMLGWLGSLVFGAAYMIVPVVSGGRLWSRRFAWTHLLLHIIGLPWMLIGFLLLDFAEVGHGGSAVLLGIILFVVNLIRTASLQNRWEVANIMFVSALFWLCVTGGLATVMLINKYISITAQNPQWLMGVHAHMGLLGFFLLILMGAALKLVGMFLGSRATPSVFSWAALAFVNIALLMLVPVELAGASWGHPLLGWIILAALVSFLIDISRLIATRKHPVDWPLRSALTGIVLLLVPAVWVLAGSPFPTEDVGGGIREATRAWYVVAVFGAFSFAIFGMGSRIVPHLAWQYRCAPQAGMRPVPSMSSLSRREAGPIIWISLLSGWAYLAAGQLFGAAIGVQIGAMMLGFGWIYFVFTVSPAIGILLRGVQAGSANRETIGDR